VAASTVSGRDVYAGVVEHSVYVHPAAPGHGTGRRLPDTLIASTEAAGIWTIQSGTGMLKGLRGTRGHMARV
jgi:phosphinothricin acetyltransferase